MISVSFSIEIIIDKMGTVPQLRNSLYEKRLYDSSDIKKDDGLSHVVCLRCMGTLEFLCDFHERCHQTQELILLAKENPKRRSKEMEVDFEFDKENTAPVKNGIKRKAKTAGHSNVTGRPKTAKLRSNVNGSLAKNAFAGTRNFKSKHRTNSRTLKKGANSIDTIDTRLNEKPGVLANCQISEQQRICPEYRGIDEGSSPRCIQNVLDNEKNSGGYEKSKNKPEILETVCLDKCGGKLKKTRRNDSGWKCKENSMGEVVESTQNVVTSVTKEKRTSGIIDNAGMLIDEIAMGSTADNVVNDDVQMVEAAADGNEIATIDMLRNSEIESVDNVSHCKNSGENDKDNLRPSEDADRITTMKNEKSNELSHSESKKNSEDEEKKMMMKKSEVTNVTGPLGTTTMARSVTEFSNSISHNIDDNENFSTDPNSRRLTGNRANRNNREMECASRSPEVHAGNAETNFIRDSFETHDSPVKSEKSENNARRSRAVPVIVKKELLEADEKSSQFPKSNKYVWLPCPVLEPEKPIAKTSDQSATKSPAPGDEADGTKVRNMQNSMESNFEATDPVDRNNAHASSARGNDTPSNSNNNNEQVRKSVIELLPVRNATMNSNIKTKSNRDDVKEDFVENFKKLPKLDDVSQPKIYRRDSAGKNFRCQMDEDQKDDNFRDRRRTTDGKFGKVSELISEEQKKIIETFYRVDMGRVDNDEVYKNVTVVDRTTLKCNICGSTYPRMDKCQVHVWGHLNMKPYCCNACDFATVTVSNVRCHIRKSHLKIKPFECHLCEKKYVTAVLLEEHLNSHTGAKPYRCKLCDFSSASRQVLSYHRTTHKPIKDISCDICGKEFFSKSRMRAHMIVHNKDKRILCKLCSTYLCNKEALQKHFNNVHSHDYVCNICGKRTKSKKALHNHRNVHSAAKYKCPICPNVYKSSHILKEHLLKHEGIRKYRCQVCGKAFAQQSHLAAHMAVHSTRRFPCPGCSRPFNRQDNMKMHTRRCDAFQANPELKSLLTKRCAYTSMRWNSDGSETPSENPITSSVEQTIINSDLKTGNDALINSKTDSEEYETDLELNAKHSNSGTISLSLRSVAVNEDFDKLKSKESDVFRIGEVDIFPVEESDIPQIHMEGDVTVIENVLGPECF